MSQVWRPLDTAPRLRRTGDIDWVYLWSGGVVTWERLAFEASYRLSNGSRQQYTLAGGVKPMAFEYDAQNAPARYAERLLTYFDWAKGTTTAAPVTLQFQPRIQEFASYFTVSSQFTVHLVDPVIRPEPRRSPLQKLLGYRIHLRFEEA